MACLGLLMSGASTFYIFLNSKKNAVSPRLLLYLHLSLLIEEICTLPFIFTPSPGLCKFVGFVSFYASLANIMAMGLLVVHYVNYISSYSPWLMKRIAKHKTRMVFGFPLITLLPFATPDHSYGRTNHVFCGLPSDSLTQNIWAIAILHFWLWIIMAIATYRLVQTLYTALKLDLNIAGKILSTIGIYVLVTMLAWLERTIPRILNLVDPTFDSPPELYYILVYIVYSIAVIYAVLLFYDRKVVLVDYQTFGDDGDEEDGNGDNRNSAIQVDWEDVRNTLHQISNMRGSTGEVETPTPHKTNRSSTGDRNSVDIRPSSSRMSSEASGNVRLSSTGTGRSSMSKESNASVSVSSRKNNVPSVDSSISNSSGMTCVNPNDEL